MVSNVSQVANAPQSAEQQGTVANGAQGASGKSFLNSTLNTAKVAATGAAVGGTTGLLLGAFPAPRNVLLNELSDIFYNSETGEIHSQKLKDLTAKPEFDTILKNNTLSPLEKAQKYIQGADKKDELLKIVKKSAKRANRVSMLASGIFLGAIACLLYDLISNFIPKK